MRKQNNTCETETFITYKNSIFCLAAHGILLRIEQCLFTKSKNLCFALNAQFLFSFKKFTGYVG